jgi:hypothetical protein
MLSFGGWSADGSTPLSHPELLHLRSRCWTHCSTTNAAPPPRGNPTLVYSRRRHLAVVYGGWNGRQRLADCWCLDMESWMWHRAATAGGNVGGGGGGGGGGSSRGSSEPAARTDHVAQLWAASDSVEKMLVFGGSVQTGASNELWVLDISGGDPSRWAWANESGSVGPLPPARTSHAGTVVGVGAAASLVILGGQDGSNGTGPAAVIGDAWVLSPLGSPHRTWSRLDWRGIYPVQRCRHSMVLVGDASSSVCVVYGGFDGVGVLDEHHSLFCAEVLEGAASHSHGADPAAPERPSSAAAGTPLNARRQELWIAERPLTEADLTAGERERATKSFLPLAMAKALVGGLSSSYILYLPLAHLAVFTSAGSCNSGPMRRLPCVAASLRPVSHMAACGRSIVPR